MEMKWPVAHGYLECNALRSRCGGGGTTLLEPRKQQHGPFTDLRNKVSLFLQNDSQWSGVQLDTPIIQQQARY